MLNNMWKNIIKDKNYLNTVEMNEKTVEEFQQIISHLSFGNATSEDWGAVTEECFQSIPENWKAYLNIGNTNIRIFGPWIVKYYQEDYYFISMAISEFGKREIEKYISKETPCIFELVKNELYRNNDEKMLEYLNAEQAEELKEEIYAAVEKEIKKQLSPQNGLVNLIYQANIVDMLSNIPSSISNYKEIAKMVGKSIGLVGLICYGNKLPKDVYDEIYAELPEDDKERISSKEGFDIDKVTEEYLEETPKDKRNLRNEAKFIMDRLKEYGNDYSASL